MDLLLVQKVNFKKERNSVNEKAKQGSKEVNIGRKAESEEEQIRMSTKLIYKNGPN
jgi:hypothetical protein